MGGWQKLDTMQRVMGGRACASSSQLVRSLAGAEVGPAAQQMEARARVTRKRNSAAAAGGGRASSQVEVEAQKMKSTPSSPNPATLNWRCRCTATTTTTATTTAAAVAAAIAQHPPQSHRDKARPPMRPATNGACVDSMVRK